jgi:hypothetical protein
MPEAPWDMISVDFIVELPEYHEYNTIMNVIDSVTKCADSPSAAQTLEYTKDKYNAKIIKQRVSPKVPPTTYKGQRIKCRRYGSV